WKGSTDQDHGNVLAVGTGDAVDRAKSSDTVRHNQRADAVDSRIRIGRVGGIELVAISNPSWFTPVFELLHEFQVVIAGNTKDVPNTNFLQAAKQKDPYRFIHDQCSIAEFDKAGPCHHAEARLGTKHDRRRHLSRLMRCQALKHGSSSCWETTATRSPFWSVVCSTRLRE